MCLLNVRSLVNKLSKFQSFVYSHSFCIICVTETWLSDFIADGEILPTDYILYRKDRLSRGGGVMIAVKSSLFTSLISSPSDLEVVCIKMDIGSDILLICCVYVPPDSSISYVSSLVNFSNLLLSYMVSLSPEGHQRSRTGSAKGNKVYCQ